MSDPRWVASPAEFAEVCDAIKDAPAYALDTEFHRERTYYPRVALMQLAWDGQVALVDTLDIDIAPMDRVLEGSGVAVLHAAEQDLEILQAACGRMPAKMFDTQVAAGFLGYSSSGLSALLARELDVTLPKGDRLTNWTKRPLTAEQVDYAAADVSHLLQLRDTLNEQLSQLGRLEWAQAECDELVERVRARSDAAAAAATAWWRLKEARRLKAASRGVAQAVAAWRERQAMEKDVPVRFVLSDMAVTALAYRPPRKVGDLRDVRGLDPRYHRQPAAGELLAVIESGRELQPPELRVPPIDPADPAQRATVTLVAAWISQRARALRLDPAVVASRADIESLLAGRETGRLAEGWRRALVGEPVLRLAQGSASVALVDGDLLLEERSYRKINAPEGGTTPE
ncbi:MAG TPA: HRDC domain-containing protein [Acidimicrobiales bacterium]|nr:HRDC domain-containing protein [Acidimicrobiales bacterium]